MTLFDPGLQPERTELAWRRTALALALGSMVSMRMLPAAFAQAWWILLGVAGLLVAAAFWSAARRRYRRVNVLLHREGDRAPLPGGGMIALLALTVTLVAFASVVIVALHVLRV